MKRTEVVDAVDLDIVIGAVLKQGHIVQQRAQDKRARHGLPTAAVLRRALALWVGSHGMARKVIAKVSQSLRGLRVV